MDVLDTCLQGQQAYYAFRNMMLEKYRSLGCMTNRDCVVIYELNRCAANCAIATSVVITPSDIQNLNSSADANCGACPPMPPRPCALTVAACINGVCQLSGSPPP
jgi:hypothetical protein